MVAGPASTAAHSSSAGSLRLPRRFQRLPSSSEPARSLASSARSLEASQGRPRSGCRLAHKSQPTHGAAQSSIPGRPSYVKRTSPATSCVTSAARRLHLTSTPASPGARKSLVPAHLHRPAPALPSAGFGATSLGAPSCRPRPAALLARRYLQPQGATASAPSPSRQARLSGHKPEVISSRSLIQLARGRQLEHQRRQQLQQQEHQQPSSRASRTSLSSSTSSLSLATVKRVKPSPASEPRAALPAPTVRPVRSQPSGRRATLSTRMQPGKAGDADAHRSALSAVNGSNEVSGVTSAARATQTPAPTAPPHSAKQQRSREQQSHRAIANGKSHDNENIRAPVHNNNSNKLNLEHLTAVSHLCNETKVLDLGLNTARVKSGQLEPRPASAGQSELIALQVSEPRARPDPLQHHQLTRNYDQDPHQMVLGSPIVTPSPSESELDEGEIASDGELKYEVGKKASTCDSLLIQNSPNKRHQLADIAIKQLESIHDNYDLEARPFARGKFAQVKRCISKSSKECFAAKCIKKRRRLADIRHEILLEIEALKLSYLTDRIVKLYEVYETPSEMILVLEMANGGELQRVLDDEENLDEQIVKKMLCQILEALIYLHDQDIAHLDIKPQNLLLTESYPRGSIKLCDFGISRRISKDCEIREICGTPDYVAPEILSYDPISLATDMWSLGVLTYVLLSGYSPFGSENKQQTFCNITQANLDFPSDIFSNTSREAIDFMQKLIVREPANRLTSRQARTHPWLVNVKT